MFIGVCMSCFFFFKQKTAYEMRISDWSSDVCSSDLVLAHQVAGGVHQVGLAQAGAAIQQQRVVGTTGIGRHLHRGGLAQLVRLALDEGLEGVVRVQVVVERRCWRGGRGAVGRLAGGFGDWGRRSEEHTSELQSIMRISYAVLCLIKKIT